MILITGATGNTGGQVARALKAKGVAFTGLVRDLEKGRAKLGADAELVQGDLADTASLDKAFKGVDTLYLLVGHSPALFDLEKNAIEAAERAGVKRVVLQTGTEKGIRADSPSHIMAMHYEAEEVLKKTGMRWTIIRPNFYMSNFLGMAAPIKEQGKMITALPKETMITMIHPADIGEAAASVIAGEGHDGKAYFLTGKPATLADACAAIATATGRDISYVQAPPEAMRNAMAQRGMPDWLIAHQGAMMGLAGRGEMAGETDWVEKLTGHAPRSLADWASETKAAFA